MKLSTWFSGAYLGYMFLLFCGQMARASEGDVAWDSGWVILPCLCWLIAGAGTIFEALWRQEEVDGSNVRKQLWDYFMEDLKRIARDCEGDELKESLLFLLDLPPAGKEWLPEPKPPGYFDKGSQNG